MFCKNCGAEIADGSAFCSKCGTSIESVKPDKKKAGKKPILFIIIAVIAVFVVILAVVVIMLLSKGNKYMEIAKAYDNTLNADNMIVRFEYLEDEEIEEEVEAEVFGKGDETAIALYYPDNELYAALDKDYLYYYNGERYYIEEDEEFNAIYNSVAKRNMGIMYNYLDFDEDLGMSFEELYDACFGFVKDYYKDGDSIRVDCDVKDSDGSFTFELDLRDFIDYVEKNNNYRMDTRLYKKIPEDSLLVVELTLDGKYISELRAALEYDHYRAYEAAFEFSNVNEISSKESEARQFIDEFVVED